MENRPPRSRPVGSPKPPGKNPRETKEGLFDPPTPMPEEPLHDMPAHDAPEPEEFQSLGSTRVVEGAYAKQHLTPEDTDIVPKGRKTADEGTILGDFKILNKLGEGAMGAVFRAWQLGFDREVALKVLFPHVAKNPKLVERLRREYKAMCDVAHPNIVEAYAYDDREGPHVIAMEFVDGESLQKWIDRLGTLTIADAVTVALNCARALDYAHGKGMVHRDIKPDNVLIGRQGAIKVADLGMVKTLDEDMALTQTGHAVGTPWYMPLEQARNAKDTDGRCDIYALGCMLYCMVTGHPPFTGRTLVEVIQAKEVGTFPNARSVNPEVSERLDLIIVKMTAKLPRYRYQTCAELVKDLESLGVEGTTLSFLDGKPRKPAAGPKSPPASSVEVANDEWYVRVRSDSTARKLTTSQLKKMLVEGTIHPTAKASRSPDDGFRALATYKEFQGTAMVKTTRTAADHNSAKYRSLYKKIEANDRKREEEEKERGDQSPSYYSSLFNPALTIGGAVVGAIVLIYLAIKLFS